MKTLTEKLLDFDEGLYSDDDGNLTADGLRFLQDAIDAGLIRYLGGHYAALAQQTIDQGLVQELAGTCALGLKCEAKTEVRLMLDNVKQNVCVDHIPANVTNIWISKQKS